MLQTIQHLHFLGIQVPPQQVLGPSKPTPNTFSEGTWILRDSLLVFLDFVRDTRALWSSHAIRWLEEGPAKSCGLMCDTMQIYDACKRQIQTDIYIYI